MLDYLKDPRFQGIEPFPNKIWLSSPTMHSEELKWVNEAIRTNWVSPWARTSTKWSVNAPI